MGRTYKVNDRWKKDRRDQNFKKSKKFKKSNKNCSKLPEPNITDSVEESDI